MIVSHDREKLLQAINYFVRNTRKCGNVKLFKLLYFLDFEHYKATGRSVTGLTYSAWPKGPVPVSLHNEIDGHADELTSSIGIEEIPIRNGTQTMTAFRPQIKFSPEHFSRRELGLLESLASEYCNADSEDMIEATHLENLPWHQIYEVQKTLQAVIPYDLAIRPDEKDIVRRVATDREALVRRDRTGVCHRGRRIVRMRNYLL
jgi:uncharacterized phage-associated protein